MYVATQKPCMSSATSQHPLVQRLREVSEERYLTQREVAEQLGVSTRTVSYWFTTDTIPQKRHRRVLAEWLDAA
jgi:transcriptional regulator with XRE-family HTH domain